MRVHHQSVIINYGDSIFLAGKYPLTWDRIGVFFLWKSNQHELIVAIIRISKSKTVVNPSNQQQSVVYGPIAIDEEKSSASNNSSINIEVETARFNWGAFFLYPFWGFANGMWWAFLISWFWMDYNTQYLVWYYGIKVGLEKQALA